MLTAVQERPMTARVALLSRRKGVWGITLVYDRYNPNGQSRGPCWKLPGGKVEESEKHRTAIRREFKEEVLEPFPKIRDFYVVCDTIVREDPRDWNDIIVDKFVLLGIAKRPLTILDNVFSFKENEEIAEVRWFPLTNMPPVVPRCTSEDRFSQSSFKQLSTILRRHQKTILKKIPHRQQKSFREIFDVLT